MSNLPSWRDPGDYPASSFAQPVPPPDVDPDGGTPLIVQYAAEWQPVLAAAVEQLMLMATWEGTEAEKLLAVQRGNMLKDLLQIPVSACDEIDTPYWDDATDVEDEASIDDQIWYGTVTDPEAPPDELDFVENALVWIFTGLIALATPELGFAPAIAFNTIAPKFLIAQKAGDVGEIIRIVVDGQEAARVDTTGRSGEIISTPVYGDPSLDMHQIYVIGELA